MFKKKLVGILVVTLMVGTIFTGCGSSSGAGNDKVNATVTISGSTSVGPVIEKAAESYKGKNTDTAIEVNLLGSSAGIKNAIEGVSEIGISSRDLKSEEKNVGLKEVEIALDGIGVITHKNNPVKDLTPEQIKDIYTGKVTNWKDIGGNDSPIVVVSREDGSGTKSAFEEILEFKAEELSKEAQIADGSGPIKTMVAGNENAIGYISLGYVDDSVHTLRVNGVEAKTENVKNGTYKIARPFLMVYKEDKITDNGKAFIDFILSEEGQNIVVEEKLIPVK